jgi:3-phosphoshikimate 1-carboxyvinyltransferase
LVGADISGSVTIKGLNVHSSQADKAILDALRLCGAEVRVSENEVTVLKNHCDAFAFDATHCPDLFPPLAVLAACCEGQSEIHGVSRLQHKESHRALTIQQEFAKMNIDVLLDGDVMRIRKAEVFGAKVDSNNDHRIAMAAAILASVANAAIQIDNASAVNKSYPSFFADLKRIQ